jgi:hypothetical protein
MALILEYYSENITTEPTSYDYIADLAPMYMTGITTETTAEITTLLIPGDDPYLFPTGIKGRTCVIKGSYGGGSWAMPPTSLVTEITNDAYIVEGNVVKVKSTSIADAPELYDNQGYWKIISYNMNRNAQQMGKFTFSLSLSYIWTDDFESMLFKED